MIQKETKKSRNSETRYAQTAEFRVGLRNSKKCRSENPSKNKRNDLSDGIIIATSALGVFGGLKVFVFAFVMEKCNVGSFEIERVYIHLGGISMIWISLMEVSKKFKEKKYSDN